MRLIDADALKKKAVLVNTDEECYSYILLEDVMDAPTIEERKIGRWSVNEVGVVRCPFCHANMNPRKNRKPKYCDECGAKLEEIKK